MKNIPDKLRRTVAVAALVLLAAVVCPAQDNPFDKLAGTDFSKQALTREQVQELDIWDLQRLRGVVFGRHGRVFKDRDIQGYLKEQAWYKPNTAFSNSML